MGNVENTELGKVPPYYTPDGVPYVETDLHTVASKKLQKEIEEDLKVEDPSPEDAKAAFRKSE